MNQCKGCGFWESTENDNIGYCGYIKQEVRVIYKKVEPKSTICVFHAFAFSFGS